MQESFNLHRRTAIITSDQGLGINNKKFKICSHLNIETFNFSRHFIISFVSAEIFLFLQPISSVVLSYNQNFCPFFLLKYITPALSSGFTGGLTGLQRWQNVPIEWYRGKFLYHFNTRSDPWMLSPAVLEAKQGWWRWWARLVHQQFNLLKAVDRSMNNFQFA